MALLIEAPFSTRETNKLTMPDGMVSLTCWFPPGNPHTRKVFQPTAIQTVVPAAGVWTPINVIAPHVGQTAMHSLSMLMVLNDPAMLDDATGEAWRARLSSRPRPVDPYTSDPLDDADILPIVQIRNKQTGPQFSLIFDPPLGFGGLLYLNFDDPDPLNPLTLRTSTKASVQVRFYLTWGLKFGIGDEIRRLAEEGG